MKISRRTISNVLFIVALIIFISRFFIDHNYGIVSIIIFILGMVVDDRKSK